MTKIEHPELQMVTEYHYDLFKSIEGELHIIGMSPNNDAHIFDAIREVNKIPKYEMIRLSKLVEADMLTRNPNHQSITEKEFLYQMDSISYIALQEGVLPPVLYLVYIMNATEL